MGLTMKTSAHHLTLITPPAELPVTLAEAKDFLRVFHDDEDASIGRMIAAAVAMIDGRHGILGRCLEPSTWEVVLDRFPVAEVQLPLGPVVSVESVRYIDLAGVEQTIAADSYVIDATPTFLGWIVPTSPWPATMATVNAVRVRFVAGRGTPEPVRQAILDMVANRYEARGEATMLTPGVVSDLAPFRRPVVLA